MKTLFLYLLYMVLWLPVQQLGAQPSEPFLRRSENKPVSSNLSASTVNADPVTIATDYIRSHLTEWGLTGQDIADMTIKDMYTDESSGITRIYFLQRYQGIPVYNAILNINIDKAGKVFFTGNRFVQGIEEKINTTVPKIEPGDAVTGLANHLGISTQEVRMTSRKEDSKFIFEKSTIATEDITVELFFQPYEEKVLLAWDELISPIGKNDKWSTRIDAVTGTVLDEYNWTVYCFGNNMDLHDEDDLCHDDREYIIPAMSPVSTEPLYNVWPVPIESPNHGPRALVTAPVDTLASPFGWHDTNGYPGAEFTITRGNNVHAYQDQQGLGHSSNDEPDGGINLVFDFPFDPSLEPHQYVDAAVVNLFYGINYMHDFSYHFGFDEASGNFQQNNYGKGGAGSDAIIARTQQGADIGNENNAFYKHSLDGSGSFISMYVFRDTKNFLTINEPASIAGRYKTSFPSSGWGAGTYVTDMPVMGEVVLVNDGIENPYTSDGCEVIINASALAGKIALIDRGGCEFGWKALQAQNAGAIGVICCNFDDDNYTMNPGNYGPDVHIPILMISRSDCQIISPFVGNGLKVSLVDPGQNSPTALDSDLDNSLVVHEFGHGISSRLVGGPTSVCLGNAEQMDEGWSDFFALAATVRPGENGEEKRGFGTYANRDVNSGKGFRRFPYSTDMNFMPLTYGDIAPNQEEHNVGEVWAAVLWDMYWAMVEKYGWSEDPYDESSGNYRAIRLVFDGLKNTPCSPGFVDTRNAILAADESLFNGEDLCTLWEVFARRGLGYSADQGSPFDAGDQKEAFDLPPICRNEVIIEKSVTDFIQPGEDIIITISVSNYKSEQVTNVIVTDEIPVGTTFKINSSNFPAILQGNSISFQLGDMNFKDESIITYVLESNAETWSKRVFLDSVADQGNNNWLAYTMGNEASNDWILTDDYIPHSGSFSWMSREVPEKARQALELNPDAYVIHVDGEHPVIRFYHRYKTKAGTNGGIIEVKEVAESKWHQVSDQMLRNGYDGLIDYLTFVSPNFRAFSGNSGNIFEATYVDLSQWAGKDIQIRFRFGTGTNTISGLGWLIDDIEYMDLLSYNSEACLTTDQGDFECAIAPEHGTIVESREDPLSSTDDRLSLDAMIYPNPATAVVSVVWSRDHEQKGTVSLKSIDGRSLFIHSFNLSANDPLTINTENVPVGIYLLTVNTAEGQFVRKVIIQK